jgi:hypothetical protein
MTETPTTEAEWQVRLRSQLDEAQLRRAARAATRAAMSRRRAHGLVERQAARLARLGFTRAADPAPFPPDLECTE